MSFIRVIAAVSAGRGSGRYDGGRMNRRHDLTKIAQVEADIRYLTPREGGRRMPVASGYRGQFHYEDQPEDGYDGFQYFPGLRDDESVPLGTTVKALIVFFPDRWKAFHAKRMRVGTMFQIREGQKIVGRGVVTKINNSYAPGD
jgi:translation elongation factor EF-Tu-like GTPase